MATIKKSGLLKYKDKAGNLYIMKPITAADNIEGLNDLLAGKENSGEAAKALTNAKAYTDQKVAAIPTPDVSAQIKTHNESQEAHPYIRGLIPTKTSQLDNDSGYLAQHQDISGKLDKPANNTTATAGQLLTKTADGQEWRDGAKDIFWATYGTTTRAEILAAHNAGKIVCVKSGSVVFILCNIRDNNPYGFIATTIISGDSEGYVPFINGIWLGTDDVWTAYQSLKIATQTHVNSAIQSAIEAAKVTVDTAMSSTSTNPVQNKVVAAAIDSAIQSAIQNTWEASY